MDTYRKAVTIRALAPELWPEDLRHEAVRGVAVGGCGPEGSRIHDPDIAHAHTDGLSRGWICFGSEAALADRQTRLHELAHVVTGDGHTARWRACLLSLGGSLDAVPGGSRSYHPVERPGRRVRARDLRPDGTLFVMYENGGVTCYPPDHPRAVRARTAVAATRRSR
jgi:hypothetical protein